MKLNAIGITSSDFKKTLQFYSILGFIFSENNETEDHIEPVTEPGSTRLMIDSKKLIKEILGEEPIPANHSAFAIEYNSPQEVNEICQKIHAEGFTVVKDAWDAFWGQRYAIVEDPDGYKVDLYAKL